MKGIQDLKEILLKGQKNIVITSHINPDGDAVGSSLGLMFFLRKYNNNVSIILPNKMPDFLKWMPEANNIFDYENDKKQSNKKIENADIIFSLDYNDLSRLGNMEGIVKKSNAIKILIDHHQNPYNFAEYTYSDISICATSEMIYHFIDKLGEIDMLDKYISICLYTGIMTDTGSFRFSSVSAKTHKILSHFIDKSIDIEEIHSNVYDYNDLERFKLLSIAINNIKIINNTAYTFIISKDFEKVNNKKGYTEGFVNYCLQIKNINLGAIFIEDKQEGIIKVSLRSKGNIDVNKIARDNFNGGGHKNASGGRTKLSLKETLDLFEEVIK